MLRKHILRLVPALCLAAVLALPTGRALAEGEQPPAGSVKSASGEAVVIRQGGAPAQLKPGDRIFERDQLRTGKTGTLGLVMRDNSTLSLGPGTSITVERFLFAPEKGELSYITRITSGSMAAVSGEITKLRPEATKVTGPGFSIGIRGTHYLVSVPEGAAEAEAGGRQQ